ncbi:hypothetical protein RJ640_021036 [Escallonia rubra]|uniref:Vacuolar amino acid transporter YPQ1 n=1 Tax=Escallonia rubra TaxID=112253 RepID=A0AA88RRM2_9ASTE|nr:hypothetical protein RJ640_021036 [Escallonia rubra]
MKSLKLSYCEKEKKPCVRWVEKYLKDCLCNLDDEISFAFGITGLICWGVAEIPQIITNFKNKSGHGVSLAFISIWILGDIFNLVGCILEPATSIDECEVGDEKQPLNPKLNPNAPVEVPAGRKDFYYMSARSLAGSETPPFLSANKARSGPSALEHATETSSEDEAIPVYSRKSLTPPWNIPRSVGYGTFLATSFHLPHPTKALIEAYIGRRILQENVFHHSAYGQWLGWLMAAIYMGGRLPQIWLNIKRGSVEGLNPLMFIFALIANATYVGSILMRSTEWEKISANMAWLLDAIVCVALDLFIILQYIYYRDITRKK